MELLLPHLVPPGGTIGIAAPAGPVDPEKLAAGEALLRGAGFEVVHRDDVLARRGYLAGDDARRAGELMALVEAPDVHAIVCARGGYGCHRLVPLLDPERVRAAAKPLVGYSDVTTLLLWQRRCAGLVGFHGPMLERGDDGAPAALADLLDRLTGKAPERSILRGRAGGGGRTQGRLTGGSLANVAASLGTPWEIETEGAILLIEDVGERPYRIDRLLQQLRAAGKLDLLVGIGVGQLVACDDPRYPSPSALEVVEEILRPYGLPLVLDLPFGHVAENFAWPLGGRAEIDGDRGEVAILERGVRGER